MNKYRGRGFDAVRGKLFFKHFKLVRQHRKKTKKVSGKNNYLKIMLTQEKILKHQV